MAFRFRKSVDLGALRINTSKSGIGYSVGTKGLRVTKKSTGGYRTTASVPGTGISYVKETSSTSQKSQQENSTLNDTLFEPWPDAEQSGHTLLRLDKEAVESLNDSAFQEYSKMVLDYGQSLSPDVSPEVFEGYVETLGIVKAEIARRQTKSTKPKTSKKEKHHTKIQKHSKEKETSLKSKENLQQKAPLKNQQPTTQPKQPKQPKQHSVQYYTTSAILSFIFSPLLILFSISALFVDFLFGAFLCLISVMSLLAGLNCLKQRKLLIQNTKAEISKEQNQ